MRKNMARLIGIVCFTLPLSATAGDNLLPYAQDVVLRHLEYARTYALFVCETARYPRPSATREETQRQACFQVGIAQAALGTVNMLSESSAGRFSASQSALLAEIKKRSEDMANLCGEFPASYPLPAFEKLEGLSCGFDSKIEVLTEDISMNGMQPQPKRKPAVK